MQSYRTEEPIVKFWKYTLLPIITAAAVLSGGCQSSEEAVSEPEEPVIIDPATISFDWQDAFEHELKEFMSSDAYTPKKKGNVQPSMFDICDIDGDGAPELIISPDTDASSSSTIYSYKNSVFTPMGQIGSYGSFNFLPELHLMNEEYNGEGFIIGKYVAIDATKSEKRLFL